jgi:integrase
MEFEGDNGVLFKPFRRQGELTLEELIGFVLRHHLAGKPSAKTYQSNARWWSQSTGSVKIHQLTDLEVTRHLQKRASGNVGMCKAGPGSRKHDIKFLGLCLSQARRWKQKKRRIDGFNFRSLKLPEFSPIDPKDVPRPRTTPRQRTVSVMEFARFFERAHEDLQDILSFLLDSGQSPCTVMEWRPSDYDAGTDCIRFRRSKGVKEQVFPVTTRCRRIIRKAIEEKRNFILKWKGEEEKIRRQVENARWAAGVHFQIGRDLRKTLVNEFIEAANGDIRPAQKAAGHSTPDTTWAHYYIDKGGDTRSFHQALSSKFGGEPATVRLELPPMPFFEN